MTNEKQIEKMAKLIYLNYDMPLDFAEGLAEFLIDEGYRKASEVAREIFAEIEDVLNNIGYFDEIDFKALKKKYTEGEG